MIKIFHDYTDLLRRSLNKVNCFENYEDSFVLKEYMKEVKKI